MTATAIITIGIIVGVVAFVVVAMWCIGGLLLDYSPFDSEP